METLALKDCAEPGAELPGVLGSLLRELSELDAAGVAAIRPPELGAVRKARNALKGSRRLRERRESGRKVQVNPLPHRNTIRIHFDRDEYREYRSALLARKPKCAYCGRKLSEETATLDHVLPQSKGGDDEPANLLLCCSDCNQSKADRTALAWVLDIIRAAGLDVDAIAETLAADPEPRSGMILAFSMEGGVA